MYVCMHGKEKENSSRRNDHEPHCPSFKFKYYGSDVKTSLLQLVSGVKDHTIRRQILTFSLTEACLSIS